MSKVILSRLSQLAVMSILIIGAACEEKQGARRTPTPTPSPAPTPRPNPVPTRALPDFVISRVTRAPDTPTVRAGQKFKFLVSVTNRGPGVMHNFVRVVTAGNNSGGFQGLKVGETKTAEIEYTIYSPNVRQTFQFAVDADNVTPEANESNNTFGPITVRSTP